MFRPHVLGAEIGKVSVRRLRSCSRAVMTAAANCLNRYVQHLVDPGTVFLVWNPDQDDAVVVMLQRKSKKHFTICEAKHTGNNEVADHTLEAVKADIAKHLPLAPASIDATIRHWAYRERLAEPWDLF